MVAHQQEIIACHECDLLNRTPSVPPGGAARCRRCGGVLFRNRPHCIERTLAISVAGLILFVVANSLPFLSFDMRGQVTETTLASGVVELYDQERVALAGLVLLTAIVAPGLQIVLNLYVLTPLWLGRRPWALATVFRLGRRIAPWSMMEVFLIGVLVALVKLADLADVVPGLGIWSFGLLILAIAGATATMDDRQVWRHIEIES